jgi:putative addiction module CopG family antidote
MELPLTSKTIRQIEAKVSSGRYRTAEDVLRAALAALDQHESFADFAPGELDALLAEGEKSIRREGTIPAKKVFAQTRRTRSSLRPPVSSGAGETLRRLSAAKPSPTKRKKLAKPKLR